ncbi:MAG: MtrB/PioB family decaheme-associated outer membrane protein [Parvularculaceae bacterium]
MTDQLMRTTAMALLPIAMMTPGAALAQTDAATTAAAATASAAQATEADDQEGQEEFSFEIAEEAEDEPTPVYVNEVEIGVGWVSDDSAEFGEFSGLEEEGPFIIGNFNLQIRDPYDSGSNEYFIANGTNLGLESRRLYAEYGRQGRFSVFALFDSTPKFLHDDARSPYIFNDGGTRLTLPAGWVPSDRDNDALTLLDASLQDVNIHHQREKAGGGLSWLPGEGWTAKTEFYRETKKGSRTIAAIFGSSGGNPAGAIVPEPVDYETDTFNATLAYSGKRSHLAMNYNLSLFRDNNDILVFQNPFDSSRWADAANFPDGFGGLALPPDNHAHQFTIAGKYLLTNKTRVIAQLNYSRMTQDDPFLPLTVNPGLVVTIPLPRNSLEGEINTITGNFGLSSQLSPKFSVRTSYRYENRDNDTPRTLFQILRGDSEDQPTDLSSSRARFTLPYSRKQHRFEADASYRLSSATKLSAGYEYEQFKRDFTERSKTREHKVHAKLSSTVSQNASAWVGIDYSMRGGTEYIHNLPFLSSRTPERLGPDPTSKFENHPLLRKYYIADRDRVTVNGAANWTPHEDFNVGVFGKFNSDDYDESTLGLTESTIITFTGDVTYTPSEMVNYRLFYTYNSNEYEQTGLSHNRFTAPAAFNDLSLQGWTVDTEDQVHTIGAGLDWTAIKNKLDFVFDYYYSNAMTDIDFTGGTNLTFGPISDLDTRLHNFEAVAEYQFSEQFWLKARYLFSDYNVTDFALDGIDPGAMNFIIGLGNQAPSFNVHVIGVSAMYRF